MSDDQTTERRGQDTPLARLSSYYLSCLTQIDSKVSASTSKESGDLDYVELDRFPLLETFNAEALDTKPVQALLEKIDRNRNRLTIFLGCPVHIKPQRLGNGRQGYTVNPIALFPCHEKSLDGKQPISFDNLPVLNFSHIRNFTETNEEAISLGEELGFSSAAGELPDLDEIFCRLHDKLPSWDWKENPDVHSLSSEPPISEITEQGIYNRAVLILAELSPYTRGLESELGKLKKLSETKYSGTALGSWLSSNEADKETPDPMPLIEAVPLNSEQREAVQRSLSNPLTVITGPPGTGKSQVVTALLMNAAWQGKKVLFASRNNKAVDVVERRANALGPRPILLRLGNNEHQGSLAEYLSSLLGAKTNAEDELDYQHHLDIHYKLSEKMDKEQLKLGKLIAARNQVDRIEQKIENLRALFGEENIQGIRNLQTEELDKTVSDLSAEFDGIDPRNRSLLGGLVWPFRKNSLYAHLWETIQEFQKAGEVLGTGSPAQPPSDENLSQWIEFRDQALERRRMAERIDEYFKSLAELQDCEPAEVISGSVRGLTRAIADNSLRLWRCWLRTQPNKLSQEQRKRLGDYEALLKLIVNANEENRSLNPSIFRRYYQTFPKIAQMLPCWAVTSLRARRLPFDPSFFDLVVIDEASQCDIASALPLLYRAKHSVVIGDPKQLRHISPISEAKDQQLLADQGLETDYASWAYSVQSLYDLACSLCRSEDIIVLRDHHRSHADIISFSNKHFYEEQLRVATRYDRLKMVSTPAVHWIDLRGSVSRPQQGGAVNADEARAVASKVRELLSGGYQGTIGVVSPFRAHANRIREIVSRDGALAQKVEFLADTVHRFQGDERDLIIFSPVISRGITNSALRFLRRNENLFNVAVTRARSKLIVIGDKKTAASSDIDYLEKFLNHVENLAVPILREPDGEISYPGPEYPSVSRPERVSVWEKKFYKALFSAGHRPVPQYTVDQYDLDFALFDGPTRRLNIEVDGERYHRDWNGEICRRDQIRNQRLMELGWDVMRFWVYEIRDDLDSCISRVNAWAAKSRPSDAP